MDRQLVNNLHLSQGKSPSTNDFLPSTSRQSVKSNSRPSKLANKNGFVRYQNKQPRGRESKSFAQHLNENVDSNRDYLSGLKHTSYRKKNVNLTKVSLKERFVQANCQFVMSAINDNCAHLKDPDLPINWELVEEVIFTCANNEVCCPVCLCYPTAAKITRCGHIYCWSCILHYLALSDKESRSCPICFETVKKAELKSVGIVNKIEYSAQDFLTFSLMKIRKNSTIALPVSYNSNSNASMSRIGRNANPTLDLFGKIFTASPSYVSSLFEREKGELKEQLLEYQQENMPEVCFVHTAFDELEKRQFEFERISSLCEQFGDLSLLQSPMETDDFYYFYQSEDGQPIYLHALNVRMLKREYGELKNCPSSITAKIIELHGESLNEDIRRRYAHLRHLPLSCEFKIAEVEFDDKIISQATLEEFSNEVNNRMKNRKRKEKAQKIRDRKIEIENKRKIYGISPLPTFQLDNTADFPLYAENDDTTEMFAIETELGSSPSSHNSVDFQSSFAKMLSAGSSAFDKTLRKKTPFTEQTYPDTASDLHESEVVQPINLTLGDFFENCVKTSKKGRKGKKK